MGSAGRIDREQGLRFFPEYLLEILVVAVITMEIVVSLALLFPAVLGRRVDLVGQFSPRPEWYFLWLYELVKYFPGKSAVFGTAIIPVTILGSIALAPWIDRDGRKGFLVRGLWFGTLLLAAILTALSLGGDSW